MRSTSIILTLILAATISFFTPTIIEKYSQTKNTHPVKMEQPRGKVISTDPPQ